PVLRDLERIRASGRKLILLTGRELPALQDVCPHLSAFDRVIAENGALVYNPATREEKNLAVPPPPDFLIALKNAGVSPLSQGRLIIATLQPEEKKVRDVIRQQKLNMTLEFNKGGVMILPTGINKESGLRVVLKELNLPAEMVVGVGDGENDGIF